MVKKGMGEEQIQQVRLSKQKIISVLGDGQWHRHKEIMEITKLSPTTLSKHLKVLEKGIIERKIDLESGEYPAPVYYRLREEEQPLSRMEKEWSNAIFGYAKEIELTSERSNGVHHFIEYINVQAGAMLLGILRNYFNSDEIRNEKALDQSLDHYVIESYKEAAVTLKEKLEELSSKGVDVPVLISDAENRMSNHYRHLEKELGKKWSRLP